MDKQFPPCCVSAQQPPLTASLCFTSPNQRDAQSFGGELTQTASAVCSRNIRDVLMPEQGKLPLSLIPTGYNIRDNEDRTSSTRLATKQIWGLLSQQRFSKLHLKNYPQDSLPCQDLPNMFFCQNNPGLQWSGKNIPGLTIPTKLSGKVQIYPYGWTACTFSNAKKVTTKTITRTKKEEDPTICTAATE